MSAQPAWHVRAYEPGDESSICALFQSAFRKPMTLDHWRWKYRTVASPADNEWLAATEAGIVGHYGVTPVRFQVDGAERLVPHGSDAMTIEEFRRCGVLTTLVEHSGGVWARVGSPFQIGFPGAQWGSVRERVGWRTAVRMRWMRRVLRPVAFLLRKAGLRAHSFLPWPFPRESSGIAPEITVRPVLSADDSFDALWRRLAPRFRRLAIRDRAWVQWRYLDAPHASYCVLLAERRGEACGYLAYRLPTRRPGGDAVLVDLFTDPDDADAPMALWRHMRHELETLGIIVVAGLAAAESPLSALYQRMGFRAGRHGFDFAVIQYGRPDAGHPGDWFLTGAEGDVV